MVGIPCDVTEEATVQALFTAAADEFGAIDVLVNSRASAAPPSCTK